MTVFYKSVSIQNKKGAQTDTSTPQVHSSIICSSQKVEATQVSTGWWIDEQSVVDTYSEYYSA